MMSKLRRKSTGELFALARYASLNDPESEVAWEAIRELRRRATPKIYRKARKLCRDEQAHERRVGIDILAQFGHSVGRPYPLRKQRIRFLLNLFETETDPSVLNSLGVSFGHLRTPRANPALLRFRNHPDARVRFGVAFGLYTDKDKYPDAIEALIELSADRDSDVRDWATFELGTQLDLDTPAIRDALAARLSDPHDETRDEALFGLAKRKDPRVFAPLLAELNGRSDWSVLDFKAAAALADARLLPALHAIQADWTWRGVKKSDYVFEELRRAIRACEAGI